MRELTQEEQELRSQRRRAFRAFVQGIKPALEEFADFMDAPDPATLAENPEAYLKLVDEYLATQDVLALEHEERVTVHTILMYLVGQLLLQRYGGIWYLHERPDSKQFLRYVVGYFERGNFPKKTSIDPAEVVQTYLTSSSHRTLSEVIQEAEEEAKNSLT